MKANIIFHGSHIQNLTDLDARDGRFGEKVFGTYTFNKALSYCCSRESGGSGILGIGSRIYVLDFDVERALKENFGSIYIVSSEGFQFDNHKGEQETWVFSIEKPVKVIYELKFENLMHYWSVNHLIGVDSEDSKKLVANSKLDCIDDEFVRHIRDKFFNQINRS